MNMHSGADCAAISVSGATSLHRGVTGSLPDGSPHKSIMGWEEGKGEGG